MSTTSLWRAVVDRDPSRADAFVYAVRSTGIYCRATCPSRRPAPREVRFFATPAAAEAAGFRACLRCRPREPQGAWLSRARRVIEESLDAPLRLSEIAARVGLSPSQLQRRFRRAVGVGPMQYARSRRLARLKGELRKTRRVTDAVYEAGFGSGSRVYESAAARLGMTPGSYRDGGRGSAITFGIGASPFGPLLVASSPRGIVTIGFGEDAATLERELGAEYPAATLRRDDRALRPLMKALLAHVSGRALPADWPLDVEATAFEWKVWNALRRIPPGETRTYAAIAEAIGEPRAARAVGGACGRNRLALLVPCHRVVPASGGSGRYRWGAGRKRALLAAEARSKKKALKPSADR